ncbi:MAG: SRPBCC domain-containing protein [Alphaproteobacteria bacterium]|nr:SRPBCC domain-containing protein [Alphaproteobacteria bacterium]
MSDKPGSSIELSVTIDAPPEAVWAALTEAEQIARWFGPETEVVPGLGGYVRVSWGQGMTINGGIEVWEPGRHLRVAESWGEPGAEVHMATDYHIETDRGRTVLRLVQSGFGGTGNWDDEFDALDRGWRAFLRNLQHLLETQAGRGGVQVCLMEKVDRSAEDIWARLLGPEGLAVAGPPAGEGADFVANPAGVGPLKGTVDLWDPPYYLGAVLPDLGDALLRVEMAGSAPSMRTLMLYLYGEHAAQAGALQEAFAARLTAAGA